MDQRLPFRQCKLVIKVSLSPCFAFSLRKGVQEEVNQYLMRYSTEIGGILTAYKNVKLVKPYAHIVNEMPHLHCSVSLDALAFCPSIGTELEGVVNKVGSNHIGMLVANVFNASVAATELPKGYVHNCDLNAWVNESDEEIKEGSVVTFRVQKIHQATGVISIEGTMRPLKKKKDGKKRKREGEESSRRKKSKSKSD